MSLSDESEIGGVAGVTEPDVPTALSEPHFRSDNVKESALSPAFRQPVTVTVFAASFDSCIGAWLVGLCGVGLCGVGLAGGCCADRPTANAAAKNVPAI